MRQVALDIETSINNDDPRYKTYGLAWWRSHDNFIVAVGEQDLEEPSDTRITFYDKHTHFQGISLDGDAMFVGHNIGFDMLHLMSQGFLDDLKALPIIWDTQIAEYIITGQSHKYSSLDQLCEKYGLGTKPNEVRAMWEAGIKTEDIPEEILGEYLRHDITVILPIYKKQLEILNRQGQGQLAIDMMEARLATILMEYDGLCIDLQKVEEQKEMVNRDIIRIEAYIQSFVKRHTSWPNTEFNPMSTQQLSILLFGGDYKWKSKEYDGVYKSGAKKGQDKYKNVEVLSTVPGLTVPKEGWKTPTGGWSVSDDVLQEILSVVVPGSHLKNLVVKIIELRGLKKELGTYLSGYADLAYNGVLHGQYQHTATATGRLSCKAPNLQNLTRKTGD